MKRFFNKRATTSVVALSFLILAVSCVNKKYELSEEKINTEVTVFQEGVTIPLGSTAQITLESLVSMLDEETQKMLQDLEGAYMFSMSDTYDLTADIQEAFSSFGALESISMDEKFSFSLSNIDLSAINIEGRPISTEGINISGMLKIPDINSKLPKIEETLPGISIALPELNEKDVNKDLSTDIDDYTAPVLSLGELDIPEQFKSQPEYTQEMNYKELRKHPFLLANGVELPELADSYRFDEYSVEVPIKITLPKMIKSVKDIKLHPDARFELIMTMENPLFTSGSFTPKVLINLHDLFHIDKIESGFGDGGEWDHLDTEYGIEHHIHDNFVMKAEENWISDHVYHIAYLDIDNDEWIEDESGALALNKNVDITLSGELIPDKENLKTTLERIEKADGNPMSIKVDIKFFDFKIVDVKMEVEEDITQTQELSFDVPNIQMPEMVEKVDYVAFDQKSPLTLRMSADVPSVFGGLDLKLQTLEIEFPKGIEVDHDSSKDAGTYDRTNRILTYSDVKLSEGLNENIRISKLYFDDLSSGALSYSGNVKVTAKAHAEGILSSEAILNSADKSPLSVDVSVNYAPQLSDYCVNIADYTYDPKVEPIVIDKVIDKEVAELFKDKPITVKLKQVGGENPKVVINLDYPKDIPAIQIRPKAGEGLKLDFPDMINFSPASLVGLRHDAETNSISFTENDQIPNEMELEITGITVLPEKDADNKYYIKDRFEVSGGVCLAATTICKADVEKIVDGDVKVGFSADIPTLSPAEVGLDEYTVNIDEKIEIEGMEIELPDMINSVDVSDLSLKDAYLDLNIDASKVVEIVGDAKMSLLLDVTLPEILKVEGVDGGVLHIESDFKDGTAAIEPVKILGLDLSEIEAKDGKLMIDAMTVKVSGSVKIEDITVNMDALEGKDIEVAITGGLATRGADGKPTAGVEIDRIAGKVGLDIDPVETSVDLSELAETLNGENMSATLDINTFWLSLNIKTNLDVPVVGNLEIVPYYGEEAGVGKSVSLKLDPAKRGEDGYRIYISNKDPETDGLIFVELDLMSILYKKVEGQKPVMASSIKVNLNAGTDPERECVINPSEEYFLTADYTVGVPLELGEDFSFEYRDAISDLPEIAGQLLSHGSLGLGGKITNGLPFRLNLQLRLLDSEGNEIPMKEGAGKMTIAPCDPTGAPVDTEIDLVLGGIEKNASDLHSIEFVFTVDSKGAAGVPLKPDSFIQVALSARIPEGVSIDLKDIMEQTDSEDEDIQ